MAANRVKQVSLLQIGRGILAMQRSLFNAIPKARKAGVPEDEIARMGTEIIKLLNATNDLEIIGGQTAGHLTRLALTAEAESN